MTLRELAEGLALDWKPRVAPFPSTFRLTEARLAVEAAKMRYEPPQLELSASVLDQLRSRLLDCRRSGDWSTLSLREWRYSNECLSLGEPRLIDDPDFIAVFLAARETGRPKPSWINLLARCYARNFEPDHEGIRKIGGYLAANLPHLHTSWVALHECCGVFESDRALPVLAAMFAAPGVEPAAVLGGLSCPPTLLSSRLFGHVFAAVCRMVAMRHPGDMGKIETLAAWAFGCKGGFQYKLIPGAAAAYAEAMLRPWAGQFPGEEIRSLIVTRVLGLMPDPRINPADWSEVGEEARAVMLGWMTKDALDQFLEVVDDTVPAHQSRMWAERRRFWMSYCERNRIRECWVVFGRRGAALARHLAADKGNPSLTNLGNFLRDLGGDPNQAVLLMMIGALVIADWSHNGRCQIWLEGNPAAPALYQAEYIRDDLMVGADFETPHHKDWQAGVDDFISRHLGLAPRTVLDSVTV